MPDKDGRRRRRRRELLSHCRLGPKEEEEEEEGAREIQDEGGEGGDASPQAAPGRRPDQHKRVFFRSKQALRIIAKLHLFSHSLLMAQ